MKTFYNKEMTVTELGNYFTAMPAFELSIDQARLDKSERENAYDWEETAGFQLVDLPTEYLTEAQQSKPLVIQATHQNAKATPLFYLENNKDTATKEAYLAQGWKDVREQAVERFMKDTTATGYQYYKEEAQAVRKTLSKACYHMNRSTNVIIFNLSSLDDMTSGQIFNAIVNNKTVLVRYKQHAFKNLKLDTPEYKLLSQLFADAKSERLQAYFTRKERKNAEYKLSELVSHELNDTKYAIATTLASIWELDKPQTEYDYQLLMATIQTYFTLKIESTRVIYLDGSEDSTLEAVVRLPLAVQELLVPLLTIEMGSMDLFGNETLLDMEGY